MAGGLANKDTNQIRWLSFSFGWECLGKKSVPGRTRVVEIAIEIGGARGVGTAGSKKRVVKKIGSKE